MANWNSVPTSCRLSLSTFNFLAKKKMLIKTIFVFLFVILLNTHWTFLSLSSPPTLEKAHIWKPTECFTFDWKKIEFVWHSYVGQQAGGSDFLEWIFWLILFPPNLIHNKIKEVTCYNFLQRQRKNVIAFSTLLFHVHCKKGLTKAISPF